MNRQQAQNLQDRLNRMLPVPALLQRQGRHRNGRVTVSRYVDEDGAPRLSIFVAPLIAGDDGVSFGNAGAAIGWVRRQQAA